MAQVGSLYSSLTLESAAFVSGLKQAVDASLTSSQKIERNLNRVVVAGQALVGAIAIKQLVDVGKRALDFASSLGEVAQQLGVTTRDLQVYRYAASQVGVEQGEMDKALQKFTKSLGDARAGSKDAVATFKQLGFSDADIQRLDVHKALLKTADGIGRISDRATRATPEVRLFGRAGQQLDTLLAGGSAAVLEFAKAAEKLGIVLSDRQIQQADEAADKLSEVKQVLEANIAGVVADNATSIVNLANAIANLTGAVVNFLGSQPEKAMTLIGGLTGASVGARVGGVPGAIVGATIGAIGGGYVGADIQRGNDDANGDIKFRQQQFRIARNRRAQAMSYLKAVSKPGHTVFGDASRARSLLTDANAEFVKQGGLLKKVVTTPRGAASATLPAGATFNLPSGGGKKSDAAAAAERAERERLKAAREAVQYANEVGRTEVDIAHIKAQISGSASEQLVAERADVEQRRVSANAQVSIDKDITEAQKAKLIGLNNERAASEQALLARREQDRMAVDAARFQGAIAANTEDELQGQLTLARTTAERRKIEQRLVDLKYEEERRQLELVEATTDSASAEYRAATARLAILDKLRGQDRARVDRQNAGPLDQLRDGIPRTADELNEALESVAAGGLKSLTDGLASVITGTESMGQTFKKIAQQIIGDLARIAIERAIIGPLVSALGGAFGGGGGVPGFATGGSFMVGGRGGVDNNLVAFRATRGERVDIRTPGQARAGAGGGTTLALTINAPGATAETVSMIRRELANAAPVLIQAAQVQTSRSLGRARL